MEPPREWCTAFLPWWLLPVAKSALPCPDSTFRFAFLAWISPNHVYLKPNMIRSSRVEGSYFSFLLLWCGVPFHVTKKVCFFFPQQVTQAYCPPLHFWVAKAMAIPAVGAWKVKLPATSSAGSRKLPMHEDEPEKWNYPSDIVLLGPVNCRW